MKNAVKLICLMMVFVLAAALFALPCFAEETSADLTSSDVETVAAPAELNAEAAGAAENAEEAEADPTSVKAVVAGAVIAVVAGVGAFCMAWAITKSSDSIARQPEAAGEIRSSMMLGLVFVETAIIYALIVAILVVFVL